MQHKVKRRANMMPGAMLHRRRIEMHGDDFSKYAACFHLLW